MRLSVGYDVQASVMLSVRRVAFLSTVTLILIYAVLVDDDDENKSSPLGMYAERKSSTAPHITEPHKTNNIYVSEVNGH